MPTVSPKFLEPYVKENLRHANYTTTTDRAADMRVHVKGEFPKKLILERRPAESDQILAYREKIFVPITKSTMSKVISSLGKIRHSQDYLISWPEDVLPEGETLREYMEQDFPRNTSITNWLFSICLQYYATDANAVVLTIPTRFDVPENEYLKPYPHIFTSDQVIDYKMDEYYVLKDTEEVRYIVDGNTYTDGQKYWVVQSDTIQAFHWLKMADKWEEVLSITNPLGYLPIRYLNGVVTDWSATGQLYETRFAGMIPFLDEAVREYSDLQAEVVQHIHSTMWSIKAQKCTKCNGLGQRKDGTPCSECSGQGELPLNPFEHITYSPKLGETGVPTPLAGYITKDTSIAKLQDERIMQHKYNGLAAINFEFLAEVPLAQSGVAKAVDKEELNHTVHAVAEDLIRIMDGITMDCCNWRYYFRVPSVEARMDMLPAIHVPEKYDIVSEAYLVENLKLLKEANADASIINAAQVELSEKMFNTDTEIQNTVRLKLLLDPFAGRSAEEIALLKTYDAISDTDIAIWANINKFVQRAISEVDGFTMMTLTEQQAVMNQYAQEQINDRPAATVSPADTGVN